MGDKKCSGDHKRHLCSLAKKDRVSEIKPLAKDAEFFCRKCGRVASDEDRVCKPEPL